MAPVDPHSFTDSSHPFATHISLSLYIDFAASTIHGTAVLTLSGHHSGDLFLDSRALTIHSVTDPTSSAPILFSLSPSDPIRGSQVSLSLSGQSSVLVAFSASSSSSALQWLAPPQTCGKTSPFVYTQCQAIHARSVFPCQDTPAARVRYAARLNVPSQLSAVMSARHVDRRAPVIGEGAAVPCGDAVWCADGRVVEEFVMEQPIPPYLFAFAVGELGFR